MDLGIGSIAGGLGGVGSRMELGVRAVERPRGSRHDMNKPTGSRANFDDPEPEDAGNNSQTHARPGRAGRRHQSEQIGPTPSHAEFGDMFESSGLGQKSNTRRGTSPSETMGDVAELGIPGRKESDGTTKSILPPIQGEEIAEENEEDVNAEDENSDKASKDSRDSKEDSQNFFM